MARWDRQQEMFYLALEQPPECLEQWLDASSAGDLQLRFEISSLIESDSAARQGFIGERVQHAFAGLTADSDNDEQPKNIMEGLVIDSWRVMRA